MEDVSHAAELEYHNTIEGAQGREFCCNCVPLRLVASLMTSYIGIHLVWFICLHAIASGLLHAAPICPFAFPRYVQ